MNLDLIAFFQGEIYIKYKIVRLSEISMIKIAKEHIGFYYLLTEIHLHTFIPLEFNIFL